MSHGADMDKVRVGQVWEWRESKGAAPIICRVLDVGISDAWCEVEMASGERHRHGYPVWEFTIPSSRYRLVPERNP